ncbi:hypothetical protein [Leptolyngbya iicbica]|uniref:Uncharacterized protein n=2 Tax=Cyanophyceae TaxID=3028117 RepID=A0A4Q7EI09_9CYAN|nr:hypothetical protein [Leptolyngbya sp. LK]RZM82757.1 hypothetical protein DYY88_05930 [Leptolyngbya sp. LK]
MKIQKSELEALGKSLRLVNTNSIKASAKSPPTKRLWYQGQESYFDVTVDLQDEAISWFQITLRGKVVSGKPTQALTTGETEELDVPPEVAYYAASKTIRDGAAINWDFVQCMAEMLSHRPDEPTLARVHDLLTQQLDQHFQTA